MARRARPGIHDHARACGLPHSRKNKRGANGPRAKRAVSMDSGLAPKGAPPRHGHARVMHRSCPSEIQRAQGMPDAGRTHGPPATKNAGGSHHRFSRTRRHSPRDGVNGCSALSSGLRACWPPSPCDNRLAGLTPASGGQDHTAWPSEKMPSSARKRA